MDTIARRTALVACALLAACGDSGVDSSPPGNLNGNWYFTDPKAPSLGAQFSGIGAALISVNGQITGNANVQLQGAQCASYGLDLPVTGTIDAHGRVSLQATDQTDTLTVSMTVDGRRSTGTYRADGQEANPYRQTPAFACATMSGSLNGMLMRPVTATYAGALTDANGNAVQALLTMQQDTMPLPGASTMSSVIPRGHLAVLTGGFAVTGTLGLASSICGVTTGIIHANLGYVSGDVLQVEFDTDSTYNHGASFVMLIDPTNGSLNVDATVYDYETSSVCLMGLTGSLTRQ